MKHAFLKAMTLVLAGIALAPAAEAQTQSTQDDDVQQENVIRQNYLGDVQKSVSGYFNTMNIKKDQAKEGLTVPWVSMTQQKGWLGVSPPPVSSGFAVATGKTGANGCPVFKVVAFSLGLGTTNRTDATLAICP